MAADEEQFTGDENDQEELGSDDGDGTNRKARLTDKKRKELKQKKGKNTLVLMYQILFLAYII